MSSNPKLTDVYILGDKLGSGTYSVVRKGYRKTGRRELVAVKCIPKSRLKNKRAIDNIVTEIELMKSFDHKHIVRMLDFFWDQANIYLVLEYCPGGDLSHFIRQKRRLPELVARRFLQQLGQALAFLHERHIVHMDLKPHNILMVGDEHKRQLKLADFGFAKHLDPDNPEGVKECRGSPLYMAPELFEHGGRYTAKCDMWSVGVILYECLFGKAPYHSNTMAEFEEKLISNKPIELPEGANISEYCGDLLFQLLQRDPDKRISHEKFFTHPFVDLAHAPSEKSFDLASGHLNKAVSLDKAGKFEAALWNYAEGVTHLIAATAFEEDDTKKEAIKTKVNSYMNRAERLRVEVDKRKRTSPDRATVTKVSMDELEARFRKLNQLAGKLSSNSAVLMAGVLLLRLFHKQMQQEDYTNALNTYERLFEQVYNFLQEQPPSECKSTFLKELDFAMGLAEEAKKLEKRPRRPPPPRSSLAELAAQEEQCRKSTKDCVVM